MHQTIAVYLALQSTQYGSPVTTHMWKRGDWIDPLNGMDVSFTVSLYDCTYLSTNGFVSCNKTYSSRLSVRQIVPYIARQLITTQFDWCVIRVWSRPNTQSCCRASSCCNRSISFVTIKSLENLQESKWNLHGGSPSTEKNSKFIEIRYPKRAVIYQLHARDAKPLPGPWYLPAK